MGARVVTVNEVLGGHVQLDIECLDRVYLNAYVPILQSSGQVVAFMTQHLGMPIPSPALFDKIGQRFRRAVAAFAGANDIPWVAFAKGDRKADVMAPYLKRAAASGRSQVAAIGVAQEFQRVWAAYRRETSTAAPQFTFAKADRRVTCYYFYLWDADFGPAFIKVCAYFPYPAKIWLNGHEWAKRQAARAGIAFTELSNGFAACEDPGALQEICDRLQPGTIEVFAQRWLHRLPTALRPNGSAGRVLVGDLHAPGRGVPHPRVRRAPPGPGVLRGADRRQPRHRPPRQRGDHLRPPHPPRHPRRVPHRHRPARHRPGHRRGGAQPVLQALPDQAVPQRRPGDADRDRRQLLPATSGATPACHNLDELQSKARAANHRILEAERAGQGTVLASPAFERIAHPTVDADGRRTPALRFGDPRVMALAGALCTTLLAATGITNKSLRALMTGLLHAPYTPGQMTYDLRRLRLAGLIRRIEHTNRYVLTPDGIKVAVFYTKLHNRLLRPLLAADQPQAPPELRAALRTIDQHIATYITRARLSPAP